MGPASAGPCRVYGAVVDEPVERVTRVEFIMNAATAMEENFGRDVDWWAVAEDVANHLGDDFLPE